MLSQVLPVNMIVSASLIIISGITPSEITHVDCHFVGVSGQYLKSVQYSVWSQHDQKSFNHDRATSRELWIQNLILNTDEGAVYWFWCNKGGKMKI